MSLLPSGQYAKGCKGDSIIILTSVLATFFIYVTSSLSVVMYSRLAIGNRSDTGYGVLFLVFYILLSRRF